MNLPEFQSTSINTYLQLDPRTKLFLLLVITTMIMGGNISGSAVYPRLVFAGIPLILLLSGRRIKVAILYTFFFTAAWLSEVFLVYSTTGILNILLVMLSGLVSRFFPCIVMGYYVMTTTRVSEFVAAMERMHVSEKIVIPLSVMFRFFPTVAEESHSINDAMRMRQVRFGGVSANPISLLEYRFVPLLISIVKIGDELSAAALTRGLGGPEKRTNICRIGFGAWDAVFSVIVLGALVFYLFI